MVVVAASALVLVVARGVWSVVVGFIDSPYGLGRTSGLLSPGQAVVLCDECHAGPASQAISPTGRTDDKSVMYDRQALAPVGEYCVVSGTSCVVTIDPARDEDSCSEDRPIAVKLAGGQHNGLEVAVPRRLLRKR
jgi:hypothetical protein